MHASLGGSAALKEMPFSWKKVAFVVPMSFEPGLDIIAEDSIDFW